MLLKARRLQVRKAGSSSQIKRAFHQDCRWIFFNDAAEGSQASGARN